MFENPEAKRVKRSKIFSQSSSTTSTDNEEEDYARHSEPQSNERTKFPPSADLNTKLRKAGKHVSVQQLKDHDQVDYGFEYDFIDKNSTSNLASKSSLRQDSHDQQDSSNVTGGQQNEAKTHDEHREQTFEFLLFKPTTKKTNQGSGTDTSGQNPETNKSTTTAVNKITIRSPTPESQRGEASGSILKPRPHSYYFTHHTPGHNQLLRTQYFDVAISGADIKQQSTHPWPGTHLAWRVTHIKSAKQPPPPSSISKHTLQTPKSNHSEQKSGAHRGMRARPSKKRRILLRQRLAMRVSLQAKAAKEAEIKEEIEREKRTKRNREKKVKKKEREKRKKLTESAAADGVEGEPVMPR